MTEERKPPVKVFRVGSVKASVWENKTRTGVMNWVTFERVYKSGEKWCSSNSYTGNELLALKKAADLAHTWLVTETTAEAKAGQGSSSEADPEMEGVFGFPG